MRMPFPLFKKKKKKLKKFNTEVPYDLAIQLLGMCPKELRDSSETCRFVFRAALFIPARRCKRSSTDEWINKMWINKILSVYFILKRQGILTHATTRMNLEDTTPK